MKKLIYSAIIFLSCTFLLGVCIFSYANDRNVDYSVPIGVYEWNYDVELEYTFTNLDFIVFNNNQDDIVYHNFSYECDRFFGISIYKYFGYNIFDENPYFDSTYITFTIYVNPGSRLYFKAPINAFVYQYDSNNSLVTSGTVLKDNSFYVDVSADHLYFVLTKSTYGYDEYQNDICINYYNENVNGNYYPYYSESRTDFNYRCIKMLSSYTPLSDDNAIFLEDILVTNNHIKSVIGWYRFNYSNYLNSTYSIYWRLSGTLSNPINQSSYNFATFDAFYAYYDNYYDYITTLDYYDYDADRELTGYVRTVNSSPTDSWPYTQGATILLDNQYVAEEVFEFMSNNGAFSYIGDFNNSTPQFADVVNTIISVPINYLRQLFNIQLLGTSLFIILCSIMTIALVIFVIKKI